MGFFSRPRPHADFSEEVQAHLDLEADRLIAEGVSPEAARAAALRAFGTVAMVKERFYEASRWMWLEQFLQDLRYAWRGMRHSPAFVATTVWTLAVGLGPARWSASCCGSPRGSRGSARSSVWLSRLLS